MRGSHCLHGFALSYPKIKISASFPSGCSPVILSQLCCELIFRSRFMRKYAFSRNGYLDNCRTGRQKEHVTLHFSINSMGTFQLITKSKFHADCGIFRLGRLLNFEMHLYLDILIPYSPENHDLPEGIIRQTHSCHFFSDHSCSL